MHNQQISSYSKICLWNMNSLRLWMYATYDNLLNLTFFSLISSFFSCLRNFTVHIKKFMNENEAHQNIKKDD